MLIDSSRTDLRSIQQNNLSRVSAAPVRPEERVMSAEKTPPPELIDGQLPGRYGEDELLGVPQPLQGPLAPLNADSRSRHLAPPDDAALRRFQKRGVECNSERRPAPNDSQRLAAPADFAAQRCGRPGSSQRRCGGGPLSRAFLEKARVMKAKRPPAKLGKVANERIARG